MLDFLSVSDQANLAYVDKEALNHLPEFDKQKRENLDQLILNALNEPTLPSYRLRALERMIESRHFQQKLSAIDVSVDCILKAFGKGYMKLGVKLMDKELKHGYGEPFNLETSPFIVAIIQKLAQIHFKKPLSYQEERTIIQWIYAHGYPAKELLDLIIQSELFVALPNAINDIPDMRRLLGPHMPILSKTYVRSVQTSNFTLHNDVLNTFTAIFSHFQSQNSVYSAGKIFECQVKFMYHYAEIVNPQLWPFLPFYKNLTVAILSANNFWQLVSMMTLPPKSFFVKFHYLWEHLVPKHEINVLKRVVLDMWKVAVKKWIGYNEVGLQNVLEDHSRWLGFTADDIKQIILTLIQPSEQLLLPKKGRIFFRGALSSWIFLATQNGQMELSQPLLETFRAMVDSYKLYNDDYWREFIQKMSISLEGPQKFKILDQLKIQLSDAIKF